MIFTITRISTATDGGGSTQNRVRLANSQPKNEHGCTFVGEDVRGSKQKRCFCDAKTRVRKCTRTYTSGQAIFKSAGDTAHLRCRIATG